jgi:CYTH domain-containing protein
MPSPAQDKTPAAPSSGSSDTPVPMILKREVDSYLDFEETPYFVDEEGKIYRDRQYRGVVPGIKNIPDIELKKAKPSKDTIMWIGFQPFKLFSRVFVQLYGKPAFLIKKDGEKKIAVEFPETDINLTNDAREIITSEFSTSVEKITVKIKKVKKESKAVVTIFLKKPSGYLYKQDGEYIFVDIEL